MRRIQNCLKGLLILIGILVSLSALWISVKAQTANENGTAGNGSITPVPEGVSDCRDSLSCLVAIKTNTFATLQAVNTLPTYLFNAGQFILSWMNADKSDSTKNMQASFTGIGNTFISTNNFVNNNNNLLQIFADLLGVTDLSQFTGNSPAIVRKLPNVNDLAYSTLLNLPPVTKGAPDPVGVSAYNYIKNTSGINLAHVMPNPNWRGRSEDITNYTKYYNMITSVISYNSYLLDHFVGEFASGNQLTTLQNNLYSQATSGNFLATVASEDLGVVLRQMLMFQSQTYVLISQLVQTQKQMVAAQAMNNALLITNNQLNEKIMLSKAMGVPLT